MYSPSAETTSKFTAVPKSTEMHGAAEAVVGGDRVDEPVGAELARVVDRIGMPVRMPGPTASMRWPR